MADNARPEFCVNCGGRVRAVFNMYNCANSCYGKNVRKILTFDSFWSRYAPAPLFLPFEPGQSAKDRVKVSDVVVLIKALPMTIGPGGMFGQGQAVVTVPESRLRVVRCVKNRTWDRVIKKEIPVSTEEWKALVNNAENSTEQFQNDWDIEKMVCFIRS